MCGICGILNVKTSQPISQDKLRAMCNTMRHRGPDDQGILVDGNIGIGMRRLSVIDLISGNQPQQNEDRTCHIVFNGEIYNYQELRKACEDRGHRFSTDSDTETILHIYEDVGADCVLLLNGMFAFAIFDNRDRSLILARDRLGIKPLYYSDTGSQFIFGSEIKSILIHPKISREIDPIALDQYLAYKYVLAPRTIFKSIRKLPPGHILTWRNGRYKIRSYWKLSFGGCPSRPEEEISTELLERLKQSVKMQMISDVPLGVLLSGGIDSSLIVALMSQISERPVKTFSIGFEERSYNELEYASIIAKQFGTEHHPLVVRPDVRNLFEQVVGHFDEPFGDSSAIPVFLVSRLAREHVTVALSGTGGDELFAGYERYWAIPMNLLYNRIPCMFKNFLTRMIKLIPTGHAKKSFILRAQRFVESAGNDPFIQHQRIVEIFSKFERDMLYNSDWRACLPQDRSDPLEEHFLASNAKTALDRLLDLDISTLLADDYLVKDDRMSMAVSLELRVPFLDHTLVEFAASLPPSLKLHRFTTKYILKKAARELLPRHIISRPKHGFEIPVARWIGDELLEHVNDLLLSPNAWLGDFLNQKMLKHLIQSHISGRNNFSRQIWVLMSLEMWHRSFMDYAYIKKIGWDSDLLKYLNQ